MGDLMPLDAMHYVPLLRAKQGELQALEHADTATRGRMTPLVDILSDDTDNAERDLERLANRLREGWGTQDRVIVDLNSLGDATTSSGQHVVEYLHDSLRTAGVMSVPTAWITASATYQAAVASAAALDARGVCLRVTTEDLANTSNLATDVNNSLGALGVVANDVDLVIDMGPVDAATVNLHVALLGVVLPTFPSLNDWRSFTLASGGFPINLDAFGPYAAGVTPRYDAQLWRRLAAHSLPRRPGYGDYGVTHPQSLAAGPWRGAPNLRYVLDDDWYVIKGRANSPRGNYDFHDICAAAASATPSPLSQAGFSWGDTEIRRCSVGQGGPGGGTQWRAWATSHHLALVTERLATLGEP